MDCDEYPFASSLQEGKDNYKAGRVSIRPINSRINQDAGRQALRPFYSKCGIKPNDPIEGWYGVLASPSISKTESYCDY